MVPGATLPTPLEYAPSVSSAARCDVWIKRDDRTHPRFGGNKVRKLGPLLDAARADGVTHLLTLGAAGSHHALATAVHGAAQGFVVEVALAPQLATPHVTAMLAATAAQAARVIPCASIPTALLALGARAAWLRARGARPRIIPVGGSNAVGSAGYADAFDELWTQLRDEALPTPDAIVVALGSGGTRAGLAAGAALAGWRGDLVGARVTPPAAVPAFRLHALARSVVASRGGAGAVPRFRAFEDALGGGYGVPTVAGQRATALFARDGVELDGTYTAKAAAGLLAVAAQAPRRMIFWHTLSSAPLGPLGGDAPVPERLRGLLRANADP